MEKANNYFETGNYYDALNNYIKINRKTSGDTLVILRIAECYKMINVFEESEKWYGTILQDASRAGSISPTHKLNYAKVLTINGKYDEALYWYKAYYFTNSTDARGMAGIKTIENINKLYYDTMFYVAYPSNINTVYAEFSPSFYGNGVVFVSNRPKSGVSKSDKGNKPAYFKWYFANINEKGKLTDPIRFNTKTNIETNFNEGPVVFYDNGKKIIFTQNIEVDKKTKGEIKVFPIHLFSAVMNENGEWEKIKRLDFCNNEYSYTHPAITSDGKTIVFSSKMPIGYGGADLYKSTLVNGIWQDPVNLGPQINTKGNEVFPYILKDSLLYFSSDGHGGPGGLDICYAPLFDTGQIVNIGFPVNSAGDDFGIVFEQDEMSGYFSSNREALTSRDDIYVFKIIRVSLFLKIIDINTSNPVSNAEVFFISGMEENLIGKTDEDGFCTVIVPVSKEIKLQVKKDDFESQVFTYQPLKYNTENVVVLPVKKILPEDEVPLEKDEIIYKVQVMASRQEATAREIKRKYKGKLPVVMSFEDDWYKYTIGEFDVFSDAYRCFKTCKVSDAFIVAYINNKRVDLITTKSGNYKPMNSQDVKKQLKVSD